MVSVFAELQKLISESRAVPIYKILRRIQIAGPIHLSILNEERVDLYSRLQLAAKWIPKLRELQEQTSVEELKIGFGVWLSDFQKLRDELSSLLKEEHRRIIGKAIFRPCIGDLIDGKAEEEIKSNLIQRVREVILKIKTVPTKEGKTTSGRQIGVCTEDEYTQVAEMIEQLDTSRLAAVLGAEITEVESTLEYIKSVVSDIVYRARTYEVPGLFINENGNGEIRKIRVTLHTGKQEEDYGLNIANTRQGQQFRDSVKNAIKATSDLLRHDELLQCSIRISIENSSTSIPYKGGSIGLAVAAAIIADVTGQEIGIKKTGDVAITGEIASENGDVDYVKHVKEKALAVKAWNDQFSETSPIKYILVPATNDSDVPAESGLEVYPISHISDLFQIMFDPWYEYLGTWRPFPESEWEEILHSEDQRNVVFKDFYSDSGTVASEIAKQLARQRVEAGPEGARPKSVLYHIPVVLNTDSFRKETSIMEVIANAVNQRLGHAGDLDRILIGKHFDAGRFALLLEGLDSYESMVAFLGPGGAMQTEIEYSSNRWFFVCNESTWQRRTSGHVPDVRNEESYEVIQTYGGRSTFLDKYIDEFLDDKGEARELFLPYNLEQRASQKIPPIKFFEGTKGTARYLEQQVREIDWSNRTTGGIQALSDPIESGQKRISILGDSGSGKTIALLKLFSDCRQGKIVDDKGQYFLPLYVTARELAKEGSLGKVTAKILDMDEESVEKEIKYTKNLLIMIDSLDRIEPEAARGFPRIIRDIHESCEDHTLILTSRKQETIKRTSILNYNVIRNNFMPYEMQDLDLIVYRTALEEAIGVGSATQILGSLGEQHENLAANPMLLYLLSKAYEEIRETLEAGGKLNKGTVLRIANRKCLEQEWWSDEDSEERQDRLEPRAIFSLLTVIAKEMMEKQVVSLSDIEIMGIIRDIVQPALLSLKGPERTLEQLVTWPLLRAPSVQRDGSLIRREIPKNIEFIHDSFAEYYAAEWLIDQLETPNWFDAFDRVGAVAQYPAWSESVHLMCDLLPVDKHEEIMQHYQHWQDYEYGLNYLVKHTALSESPKIVLNIMTPLYVNTKVTKLQSVGPVLDDLSTAIMISVDSKDLVSAFKFAVLREHLSFSSGRTMAGLESVLRVCMGEIESGLVNFGYLDNLDDRLLVCAELAIQLWDRNRELAKKYLHEIDDMSSQSSPETLELVAVRIAEIDAAFALKLAKQIADPEKLYDWSKGIENPTSGRCVFHILSMLAEHDLSKTATFVGEIEGTSDQIYAYIVVGSAILSSHPVDGFGFFKQALSLIEDDEIRRTLAITLAEHAIWTIPLMDLQSSVQALHGFSEIVPLLPDNQDLVALIDFKISECPSAWVSISDELSAGSLRDFVRWRLMACGYLPLAEPDTFSVPNIQDMIRAARIAELSQQQPTSAVEISESLTTLAGYVSAVIAIARQMEEFDPISAEKLVDYAFTRSVNLEHFNSYAALKLLKAVIHRPCLTRSRLLRWCLDHRQSIKQEPALTQSFPLSRTLADAFLESKPNEADFFNSIIQEFHHEECRKKVALNILQDLPEDTCKGIAQRPVEFGLMSKPDIPNSVNQSLFLPETQSYLLAFLAERLAYCEPNVASQLVQNAVELLTLGVDEIDRKPASYQIIRSAMKISPSSLGKRSADCVADPDLLFLAIKDVINELTMSISEKRERILRLESEITLSWPEEDGGNRLPSNPFLRIGQLRSESGESPSFSVYCSSSRQPSSEWLQDLANFFSQCVDRNGAKTPSLYLSEDDLHRVARLVAELDWETFMTIVREPRTSQFGTYIPASDLPRLILTSGADASQLIEDIASLQKSKGLDSWESNPAYTELCRVVVAASVAYDPDTCINMLSSVASDLRCGLFEKLPFDSEKLWTEQQLARLFGLLEACNRDEEFVIAEAHILSWLGQSFPIASSILDKVIRAATSLSEPSVIRRAADYIEELDTTGSISLRRVALEQATEDRDAEQIVYTLDEEEAIAPEIRLRALEIARDVDEKSWYLGKIAKQQAKLDLDRAIYTLSLIGQHDNEIDEVLASIAEAIALGSEDKIELWLARISELPNLDDHHRNFFARTLIERGLAAGVIRSSRTFSYITQIDDKVEAFVFLSTKLMDEEKSNVLTKAHHEAENASFIQERERAFRILAEYYMTSDREQAVEFYRRALIELREYENAVLVTSEVSWIMKACCRLPTEQSMELASLAYNVVQDFPYESAYYVQEHSKFDALIEVATALWPSDKSEGIRIIKEAANEYIKKIRLEADVFYSRFAGGFKISLLKLAEHSGPDAAMEMLHEFLRVIPGSQHRVMVNGIVEGLCEFEILDEKKPPGRYDIWVPKRLDKNRFALLEGLFPLCSVSVTAKIHLAFGTSKWGSDHEYVLHEITRAAGIAEELGSTLDDHDSQQIWVSYAAAEGFDGCLRAASALLSRPRLIPRRAEKFLLCAIDQVPQKLAFLRSLWVALQSLKEYVQ